MLKLMMSAVFVLGMAGQAQAAIRAVVPAQSDIHLVRDGCGPAGHCDFAAFACPLATGRARSIALAHTLFISRPMGAAETSRAA